MFRLTLTALVGSLCIAGTAVAAPATTRPTTQLVVPIEDPALERPRQLVEHLRGKHPRLLLTAEDIPALKAKAAADGKTFFDQLEAYLPSCEPPTDGKFAEDWLEAQRQAIWRGPTVGLHYLLTGNRDSFEKAMGYLRAFMAAEDWSTGRGANTAPSAGNIMAGTALLYDWLYNDLDPAFRQQVAAKLTLQARRMYYAGHLNRLGLTGHWQADPLTHGRWHRTGGMAMAAMAVAGEPGSDWIVDKALEELEYIHHWLPQDGSGHESSSLLVYALPHLVMAMDSADRCFGTDLLGSDFFKNTPGFRVQLLAPGMKEPLHYADSGGLQGIHSYAFRCASRHGLRDEQAAMMQLREASPQAFGFGWISLIWFDPKLSGGSVEKLPKQQFFPNPGIAVMRQGWGETDVALMFKCSPFGGAKLNEFRNSKGFTWINVIHNDPDANMFILHGNGQYIADTDRHSHSKKGTNYNTILVDGRGQRGSGHMWMQPLDDDMTQTAYVTAWKQDGAVTAVEGEAAGTYEGLQRYRRTAVWVENAYILILDDIIAAEEKELTWLVQGSTAQIMELKSGHFRLGQDDSVARCDVHVHSELPYVAAVVPGTADANDEPLNLEQLQLTAKTKQWRLVTLLDPWKRDVKLSVRDVEGARQIVVEHGEGSDTWTWVPPADGTSPSGLSAQRSSGARFELK